MQHGKRWTYMQGCRCAECRAANTTYHRRRRHGEAKQRTLVAVSLVRPKLDEARETMSIREIARRCDVSDTTIHRILDGQQGVELELANKILRLTV